MQYRKLKNTGEKVSVLGFGAMRLPIIDGDTTKIDEPKATEMIRHAIDSGINYVDTAWPYHGSGMGNPGMSEPFVGKVLKDGYREKVFLATKLPTWLVDSREKMDELLNLQLERLQTDYIDFYLVHTLNKKTWANVQQLGIIDFLEKAKADGKIKHIGFSFHDDPETFKKIVDDYEWEFCQIQYNYLDTDYQAGKEGLHYAYEKGLDIIIMEPLRGGSLVNNLPPEIEELYKNASTQRSAVDWALSWLWNQKEVGTVLSGMSDMAQLVDNIQIADRGIVDSFTDQENTIMDKVQSIFKSKMKIDCTKCRYCMPCPAGVEIPEIFSVYNKGHIMGNIDSAKFMYNALFNEKTNTLACIECGKCESHCPQGIEIIKNLKVVHEELANKKS
jgi:predicted aldo/keto reductase-like oxidoreductase